MWPLIASLVLSLAASLPALADAAAPGAGPLLARGVVRPINQATISAEVQMRVAKIPLKEGDTFKAGDLLVDFDCRRQRAELAAAEAQQLETKLMLDNNLALDKLRAVARHEIEISKARLAKTSAEVDALRARLDQCQIIAPFNGRISELAIHEHETPSPGRPFLSIIADAELEIELIAPSDWLGWLKPDARFTFVVDEVKHSFLARVSRIGAAVDPVSQTIKVVGRFDAKFDGVLAGMSGAAEFLQPGE